MNGLMFGASKETGIWLAKSSRWTLLYSGHDALYIAAWRFRLRIMRATTEPNGGEG